MVMRRNSKRTENVIQHLIQWKNERTGIFANSSLPETQLPRELKEEVMSK